MIDDADDARVRRNLDRIEREARFLAADEEHFFTDAGPDRVHRHERPASGFALGREWLHEQQRDAREMLVLARGDDGADDFGELHYSATVTVSTTPTMAASTGQSFMPEAM